MGSFQEAAPALLGCTLLVNEKKHDSSRPSPASCGSRDIDIETLEGGFRYGEITSVSGASGTGKTTLAFHAIASHLIAHADGEVALIATTDPPLTRLRDILITRLALNGRGVASEKSGCVYKKKSSLMQPTQDTMDQVSSMLGRVRISRSFDFLGVAEALFEFSASLEEKKRGDGEQVNEKEFKTAQSIADSEDEDVEVSSAESELGRPGLAGQSKDEVATSKYLSTVMIVVDNIANVVGSMMTKSQVQGHALLANFMRSLHQLTKRRHSCTLILNSAVGLRSQETRYHRRPDDQASVFASVPGKPALGKHFSFLVDTSIFLSTIPRSKDDADIAYGDVREGRQFNEFGVIEVLKDRHGGTEGRWSAFTIEKSTELRRVRF